jgi:hypothetical protein
METCTVETGLLKKKPCGATAVTHCKNCEQPLCSKHATPQMSDGKKIFLCAECAKAWKDSDKAAKAMGAAKPGAGAAHAATPKPATPSPAPAQKKPAPEPEHSGPLEFTPSKKPEDKK